MTNTSVKGRNSFQTAGSHQVTSAAKNALKQSLVAAAESTSTSGSIPSTAASTVVPNAPANLSTLIKMCENAKYLPRYTAALSKPATDLFPAEELDGAQLELELLLSTVSLRYRSLKSGFDSLDREDKNHKKNEKHTSTAPGKRKRDDNTKKTAKEAKAIGQSVKMAKVKVNASGSPAHSQHTDDSMDGFPTKNTNTSSTNQQNPKVMIPKNDIPNKFWLSVEPYCMPITQEDIKLLDELIEEYSGPLVPPIPELGPHYTSQWTTDDLRDEQDNSNQNAKANKRFTNASNSDVINMIKKGDKLM